MKVAVLPFNAAENSDPALGRQFSNFVCEVVRTAANGDVHSINYLARTQEGPDVRASFVNIANTLVEYEFIKPLFEQVGAEESMDGLFSESDGHFKLTVRFFGKESNEPVEVVEKEFDKNGLFKALHELVILLARHANVELPENIREGLDFGTKDVETFLLFIRGFDALSYIQQAEGAVTADFDPKPAFDLLMNAVDRDKGFAGPFDAALQLSRACNQFRLGTLDNVVAVLQKLVEFRPKDFRPHFALGEVFESIGNFVRASDEYEKALQMHSEKAEDELSEEEMRERIAIYVRLGVAQRGMGMPINAERSFRRAVALDHESPDPREYLAQVLVQTNRAHELPQIWREWVEQHPQDAVAHTRLADCLIATGSKDEGIAVLEKALETVEDNVLVKRYYAPKLAESDDLDRAMDFFEDVLDAAPTDVSTMLEYARTLQKADREFEVPKVLKDALACNPEPNIRAQTQAWLIELEQPKRAEAVDLAREKLESGDFEGVVRDLKPLRNWLADYWKLWALLSNAYNRLEQYPEAEDAANRLLNLFPGCEPGYAELVQALSAQNRFEEAYNVMRHAASNLQGSIPIYVNLALAAKRAGHIDEAKSLAKQIREAVGPNEELEPILAEIET